MNLTPQAQALIWRFVLMFALGEGPAVINALSQPEFNWRLLALGLVTGGLGVLEKLNAPQLSSPDAVVSRGSEVAPPPPH